MLLLTMKVTVASCERSFSKLKLLKNFLGSTLSLRRLSDLAILSIEASVLSTALLIHASRIVDAFIIIIINEFHRDASLTKTSGPL